MKRIASPMFGGLVSLTILTLIIIPIAYRIREERVYSGSRHERRHHPGLR